MYKFYLVLFLLIFIFGCSSKPSKGYAVIPSPANKEPVNEKQLIDITELVERTNGDEISEFKDGQWLIAVHSYKTGYTYFYDRSNKLLGKRSEFADNPREELIREKLLESK